LSFAAVHDRGVLCEQPESRVFDQRRPQPRGVRLQRQQPGGRRHE